MSETIYLKDNDISGQRIDGSHVQDILRIANVGRLKDNPDLLVFPQSFADTEDGIGDLPILNARDYVYSTQGNCISLKVYTGNMMGFVGVNDTFVSIHSRFAHEEEGVDSDEKYKDYFLYYMLQKVLSINVMRLEHLSSHKDKILDFLLFLFPGILKKALSQGLYREYVTRKYDDSHVRGAIDINRFIRNDIPFKGGVSYNARENSYDNSMTQLIRHTIEFIKYHPFGRYILRNDPETQRCVSQITTSTPTYSSRNHQAVINANLRPKVHPYYLNYRTLQQLCLKILRHETLRYGTEKDKVYGILFDGAWLWEEYIASVIKDHMRHLTLSKGGKYYLFTNRRQRIVPDYLSIHAPNVVGDAKYIALDRFDDIKGERRATDIYYKTVMYMLRFNAKNGFLFFPTEHEMDPIDYKIDGNTDRNLYKLGLKIASGCNNYDEFCSVMNKGRNNNEKLFIAKYLSITAP